jgi:hypothetical protein
MIHIPSLLNKLLDKVKPLLMEELNPDVTSSLTSGEMNTGNPVSEATPSSAPQAAPVKNISWMKGLSAVFNGLGVGLLLGILLGLSVSPVVSGVIAALSGLLAVLLGLDEKYIDTLKSIRIGSFGLATVAGVLLGLYIRAHDPFSPSLLDKKKQYLELGFTDAEAKSFIMKRVIADSAKHVEDDNVLFSSSVSLGDCTILNRMEMTDPADEIVNTFNRAGGTWGEFATAFETDLTEDVVGKALISMRDCFCGTASGGKIEMTNLGEIRKLGTGSSVGEIEEVLNSPASGANWQMIVKKVNENFPGSDNKSLYLSIIKVLSHE